VILVDSQPQQQWLRQAVEKRLREELAKLLVEVNEEKSRKVDLQRGESFGFLGFEFRRVRSHRGRWLPLLLPKGKKQTALLGKLKEIFRDFRSQPGQLVTSSTPQSPFKANSAVPDPGRETRESLGPPVGQRLWRS
jgi:RNA-directed DNA polymerase